MQSQGKKKKTLISDQNIAAVEGEVIDTDKRTKGIHILITPLPVKWRGPEEIFQAVRQRDEKSR